MRFLFVTWKNDAGQLAWEVKKEGHEVKLYIDYKSCADCYDGLIEKVRKPWQNQIHWADVVVFDEIGFAKDAEKLRRLGKKVIGGTIYTDKLEWNREFGQAEMERLGMKILPYWKFSDYEKAIRFISKNPGRYVFKPHGAVSAIDHNLLFVGQKPDGKDVLEKLKKNRNKWKYKIKSFTIQEFAEGIEIAIGGFFNGKRFLFPLCVNQEYKRLFPGNLGPLTNDMGSLIYWSAPNKMYEMTLKKIEAELSKTGYVGYFDVNCIANRKGVFPLEFTSRFGYPTIDAQLAGLKIPAGEFLYRMASGENFAIKVKNKYQIGVCGALMSYLFPDDKAMASNFRNLAVETLDNEWNIPGFYYKDIQLKGDEPRVGGESKFIGVATGSGDSADIAAKKAYSVISKIKVPNMFYRNDIGKNWKKDFTSLKKYGYLNK